MLCIYCGYETSGESACPYCHRDLSVYRRILRASNALYNEGLEKARVRDLSGAAVALNRSLKFNKYHIDARNLLGLVYFETGQMVLALREWVISKNFQPENNLADSYLNELQRGQMNRLDQVTKKYNLAIEYCRTGDYDLAMIQLKRVLSKNTSAIHAHQLLALLYLREGNPEAARKQLLVANRIDVNNATTLIYLQEANDKIKEKSERGRRRHRFATDEFSSGQEAAVSPKRAFMDAVESSRNSILNIVIGIIVGILASIFLILPSMRQNANDETVNALLNANEDAAGAVNSMALLKDQVKMLEEKIEAYEGQADVKTSYENLLEVTQKVATEDWEGAMALFPTINRDLLDAKGQESYDAVGVQINAIRVELLLAQANEKRQAKDLAGAIESYKELLEIDETHGEGATLYALAECYRDNGDKDAALSTLNRIVELFDKKQWGRRATREIGRINQGIGLPEETAVETEATPQETQEGETEEPQ